MTAALMFQGTGSDVGKSMLVAGLARAFTLRGLKVQPFKPQNMSYNAAVTADGGEIGRAQALQARACGLEPSVHMNPVLLKPQSEVGAQVVVQGRVVGNARARDYQKMKPSLLTHVMDSYQTLQRDADLILIEGAGSAAELNLRAGDIANMGFACEAKVPVVLIADIERGGVLASIVGTYELLPQNERAMLSGYIVNKFRGDATLFDNAIDIIAEHSALPCFGVVPWFHRASELPAEDAMNVQSSQAEEQAKKIKVVVPTLSRMANFDDLDPLIAEVDVDVQFIAAGQALPGDADLIVLPGSKSTLADLQFLREQGWDIDIAAHVRRGGWLLGICAGFQMLGQSLSDPQGIEGEKGGQSLGLGLIDVQTEMRTHKRLRWCTATDNESSHSLTGYEMHMGETHGAGLAQAMLLVDGHPHGAVAGKGKVMGCYLHGLFTSDAYRHAFLQRIRTRQASGLVYEKMLDSTLDALAQHLEQCLDLDDLLLCAKRGLSSAPQAAAVQPAQRWQ